MKGRVVFPPTDKQDLCFSSIANLKDKNVFKVYRACLFLALGCFIHFAAQGSICMVMRGNCTFSEKTVSAQQLGAKGIIIADSAISDSTSLVLMGLILPYAHHMDLNRR